VVDDALSRPKDQVNLCVAAPQLRAVDFGEMALLQLACPDVQLMRDSSSLKITQVLLFWMQDLLKPLHSLLEGATI
jgi:hypothetical protein